MKSQQVIGKGGLIFTLATTCVLGVFTPKTWGADSAPVTTADPQIQIENLKSLLLPLTQAELVIEANGWRDLVKQKVTEISQAEIASRTPIEAVGAAKQADDAPEAAADTKAKLQQDLVRLREQRTALIDRFNAVLTALKAKGGDVAQYEVYVAAVTGISLDVKDVSAVWTATVGWLQSPEGGLRWAKNIILFVITIVVFVILGRMSARAVRKALDLSPKASDLLKDFVVRFVRRTVIFVGLLIAITRLEVSIGPLLAVIGATGFVVGFALQGTLSNFASGLMILAYRPFDVGDAINVAGVAGAVESMNLVSTHIKTFDNQRVIVPNNSIWGGVITNITGLPTRRVDLVFGIGYEDDADRAKSILEAIVAEHALVLDDPSPVVQLHELADSSVNFICRPWVKTSDYWTVYWDVTRTAKQRFDAEGISIPFPQSDVHVHQVAAAT
ncbi:MAG: mechanosensitive ion channel [bacterium]|nr:mechanosensitive ion channel [bacterium]